MDDVKDYTSPVGAEGNTHYTGVPSEYGRRVEMQNKLKSKYCEPGASTGEMKGEKSNAQVGP